MLNAVKKKNSFNTLLLNHLRNAMETYDEQALKLRQSPTASIQLDA